MRLRALIQIDPSLFDVHFPHGYRVALLRRLSNIVDLIAETPVASLDALPAGCSLGDVEVLLTA